MSRLLFPDNPVAPLVATTSAWLVLALVLLAPTLVGSVSLGSPLAASGVSLAAMRDASCSHCGSRSSATARQA